MADTKISELAAAGALAGTEQVPIVQSGATKRTTIDDLVQAGTFAWTDYTPTLTQSGAVTKTVTYAFYAEVGDLVTVFGRLAITGTGTAGNDVVIGLPVAAHASLVGILSGAGFVNDTSAGTKHMGMPDIDTSTTIKMSPATGTTPGFLGSVGFTAGLASGDTVDFALAYRKA